MRDGGDKSRFLTRILRHKPEVAGIELDQGGWVDVPVLLAGCAKAGRDMSPEELASLVATNAKQRFEMSRDGRRIRACQGHSIPVDLGHPPCRPPSALFHGTSHNNLEAILREGIQPVTRHHVHLSTTIATAIKVGRRHGIPRVLRVDSGQMYLDGFEFVVSTNKVWLTRLVPAKYLSMEEALQ